MWLLVYCVPVLVAMVQHVLTLWMGGDSLQVLRAVVNVFNKQLQKIDKVCSFGVVDFARS